MALLIPGVGVVDGTDPLLLPGGAVVDFGALATVNAALAATEAADVAALGVTVKVAAALAATEAPDVLAFDVSLPVATNNVALAATESPDVAAFAVVTGGAVETGRTPGGSGYPVYWQGKRRKRRLEEQPNLHLKKVLDDVVKELYGELTEDEVPPEVQAKAAKLVKPFVKKTDKKLAIPPEAAVDWQALEKDAARVRQLVALWRKQEWEAEIEAEDEYLLMIA